MCAVCKPDHRAPLLADPTSTPWGRQHLLDPGFLVAITHTGEGSAFLTGWGAGAAKAYSLVPFCFGHLCIYANGVFWRPQLTPLSILPLPTPPLPPHTPIPTPASKAQLQAASFLLSFVKIFFLSQTRNSYSPTLLVTLRLVTGLWVRTVLSLIKGVRASHRALSPSKSQP